MKLSSKLLCVAAPLIALTSAHAQMFTSGDLVVTTYGNANTAATNSNFADGVPTPITLTEFTTDGSIVLADTLPTTAQGNNLGIVGEYGSSSEGSIQLSGDGQYLTFAGYSAAPSYAGTGGPSGGYSDANGIALAQSTSTDVPRVIALVDANGNVNTSTVINDLYSTNNPRSVYSPDGSTLYLSGQGSGTTDQGIYLTTTGTNTVTNPASTPTTIYNTLDTRTLVDFDGNLYYSQDKKNKSTGIFMYTGNPTSSSSSAVQIIAANNGLAGASRVNYSPQGFFFANDHTLYVADTGLPKSGGVGDGGIQKWVLNGSTWQLQYTLVDPNFVAPNLTSTASHGETGFEAITGKVVNGVVSLYAVSYTAGDADPNGLYGINDVLSATSGAGENFTELAASGTDNVYKGISFAPTAVPEPSTYAAILGGFALIGSMGFRRRRSTR
jgi:hypothetical protein